MVGSTYKLAFHPFYIGLEILLISRLGTFSLKDHFTFPRFSPRDSQSFPLSPSSSHPRCSVAPPSRVVLSKSHVRRTNQQQTFATRDRFGKIPKRERLPPRVTFSFRRHTYIHIYEADLPFASHLSIRVSPAPCCPPLFAPPPISYTAPGIFLYFFHWRDAILHPVLALISFLMFWR